MKATKWNPQVGRKVSEKKLEALRMRAADVVSQLASQSLAFEIADRIVDNAKLVGLGRELRKQVLIVLADYRDHDWANKSMASEAFRFHLMERILEAKGSAS